MNLRPSKSNMASGFTLIEILIAISILSIGLLAVASMQVSAIRGNSHARHVTEGVTLAQDKLEELLYLSYTHADLSAGHHTDLYPPENHAITWDITDGPNINPNVIANTKLIVVMVHGENLKKEIVLTCLKPKR
jgi:prepilin-type N-terminal cleavage/methylation domain-containing protein